MVLVLDGWRPADLGGDPKDSRPELNHFRAHLQRGVRFREAYVGHLPARRETGLNVLREGLLPRHRKEPPAESLLASIARERGGRLYAIAESEAVAKRMAGRDGKPLVTARGAGEATLLSTATGVMDWRVIFAHFDAETPIGLARVVTRLDEAGVLKDTALVVTATYAVAPTTRQEGPPLAGRAVRAQIVREDHDSALRFWLTTPDIVHTARFAAALRDFPGVNEVYARAEGLSSYVRTHRRAPASESEARWAAAHSLELIESMSPRRAPDVLVALGEGLGYGPGGDHGGLQESVQRIPLWFLSPGLRPAESSRPVRLVDVSAMLARLFSIEISDEHDGDPTRIEEFLTDLS
jgi:hypothetical protein